MKYKRQLYKDAKGEHRWRLKSANGNIVADSGEGYSRPSKAASQFEKIMQSAELQLLHNSLEQAKIVIGEGRIVLAQRFLAYSLDVLEKIQGAVKRIES